LPIRTKNEVFNAILIYTNIAYVVNEQLAVVIYLRVYL